MANPTTFETRITAGSKDQAIRQAQATRGMWGNTFDTYIWQMDKSFFVITSHRNAALMPGYEAIFNMNGEKLL